MYQLSYTSRNMTRTFAEPKVRPSPPSSGSHCSKRRGEQGREDRQPNRKAHTNPTKRSASPHNRERVRASSPSLHFASRDYSTGQLIGSQRCRCGVAEEERGIKGERRGEKRGEHRKSLPLPQTPVPTLRETCDARQLTCTQFPRGYREVGMVRTRGCSVGTTGFVRHHLFCRVGCTRTRHGYGVCGCGYGVAKADLRYTCIKPYLCEQAMTSPRTLTTINLLQLLIRAAPNL